MCDDVEHLGKGIARKITVNFPRNQGSVARTWFPFLE